jgi:hypothetical protein
MVFRTLYRGLLYAGNLFRGLLFKGQAAVVTTPRQQREAVWGYVTRVANAGTVTRSAGAGKVERSAIWGY